MVPATTSLVGFNGEIKWPLGQITLLVKVGDDEHSISAWMDFMVVRSTSPFNGIIGRPGLRKMKAVPSTTHGMIKFPVMGGILTLRSSKIIPIECAMVSGPEDQPPPMNKVKEERIKVAINPEHPEQTVMIGSDLTEKTRSKLCNLLQRSLDIFAWTPTDMTGVPRQIAEHKLNVRKWLSTAGIIREAKSKRQMEKYYNNKVRNTSFKPGDLVYRRNEASRVEDTGKLGPKWEGPYEVTQALGKGSYKLKDRNGKEVPRT
ncbi:hypothetical protein Tco_1580606 [Tanacetum coccineum]